MGSFFRMISGGLVITCLLLGCMSNANWQATRACKTMCQERLNACTSTCQNSCKACSMKANNEAWWRHQQYKQQRCLEGTPVVRELKSYRDPLQCRKTTCECPADFQACVQSCSGSIPKHLQKVPVC